MEWIDSTNQKPQTEDTILVRIDGKFHIAIWNEEVGEYLVGCESHCNFCGGFTHVSFDKQYYGYADYWKPISK